ncbi:MAG: Rrf2 family transcriptional regulator [bacterium]|nr:Rrf2 family transcriptional regulator [bacterium]
MLEIGSKGEYGARAMVYLAKRYGRGSISLTAISEEQHIPRRYLEQLISTLRNGGYVRATRGAAGGYELAKPPSEITLYDIVALLEGPLQLQDCVHYNGDGCCTLLEECSVRDVWVALHRTIHNELKKVTLDELAERSRRKRLAHMNGTAHTSMETVQ